MIDTAARAMHRVAMRLTHVAITLSVGLPMLAACTSSEVRIAPQAVDEVAAVLGRSSQTLDLNGDQIGRLAAQGGVAGDAIRSIAPQADSQPLWRTSLNAARDVNQRTAGDVRNIALGVACDAVDGKVTSVEQLTASLSDQIKGLPDAELQSVTEATVQMWQDLYDARASNDSGRRATAVIVCYIIQSVP